MRTLAIALATAALASPLAAQGGMAGMNMDPTNKIVGSGELPSGWMMRFDPVMARAGRPTPPMPKATDVSMVTMGSGYHFKSGPAAVYYRSADMAKGEYMASASFSQAKSMQHEAYGLVVGGASLQDSTQRYLYFIVRPMDGAYMISRRSSDARPTSLVAWTPSEAVNKEDATTGKATNTLAVHVMGDAVMFMANGKTVRTIPKSELGASTDGVVGLRVNHNMDLHVHKFAVSGMKVSK